MSPRPPAKEVDPRLPDDRPHRTPGAADAPTAQLDEATPEAQAGAKTEPGPPAGKDLRSMLRTVSRHSILYFIAEGGVRAATLLVTPLYTHAMTPRDYGVLAVAASVSLVVTLVLSVALDSAVMRLTLDLDTEEARRELYGTILTFLLTVPLVVAVACEVLGSMGYLDLFRGVPYDPYLRYAVWSGYLAIFAFLPVGLYTVKGEPRKVLSLRFLTIAVQVGSGVTMIVILHQGVIGALRAILLGAAVSAVVSIALMIRHSSFRPSRRLLAMSLAFCIPIVPHSLANWVLMLSDRVVLERYVTDTALGLYQLGYLVGGAAALFTNAFASAVSPLLVGRLRDERTRGQVPPLGTYGLTALTFLCVVLALFGGTAIHLVTPETYAGAAQIVPWIAGAYVCVAMYIILSWASWYMLRTGWIAIGTLAAAVVNIGATFLFGSWLGIVGAGVATVIGYGFLALIQGVIARRIYPIAWEYRRWAKLMLVAGACLGIGVLIGDAASLGSLALRSIVMVLGFPLGLYLVRFWTESERAAIARLRKQALVALGLRWRRLRIGALGG